MYANNFIRVRRYDFEVVTEVNIFRKCPESFPIKFVLPKRKAR